METRIMVASSGPSMTMLRVRGQLPRVHSSVFLAKGTHVIGDVEIGAGSSVWFGAVIRGDVHWIRIGERTNIQDLSVLHVTTETGPLKVGSDVTVGHRAILHGCTVEDGSLIGMGSIVLDGARVGRGSLVAAGSVVSVGFEVPPETLVAGVPASIKRSLRPDEVQSFLHSARHYSDLAQVYQQSVQEP